MMSAVMMCADHGFGWGGGDLTSSQSVEKLSERWRRGCCCGGGDSAVALRSLLSTKNVRPARRGAPSTRIKPLTTDYIDCVFISERTLFSPLWNFGRNSSRAVAHLGPPDRGQGGLSRASPRCRVSHAS